jgi:transposase-like protein
VSDENVVELYHECKATVARTGEICKKPALRGKDVCPQHDPGDKTVGRRTKWTPEVREKILEALKVGSYMEVACDYANVSRTIVFQHLKAGREDLAAGTESEDAAFADATTRATAQVEIRALALWQESFKENPQEIGRFLERRYATRYGKLQFQHHVHEDGSSGISAMLGGRQPIELSREARQKIMRVVEEEALDAPVDAEVVEDG